MAEYNPSKIIKDGNTYNFRDTTKIPLAGSNQISGDLIPATTNAYDLGGSSYQWNNAYIKSLTINGVACGDILTHNASEFVDVSSAQTIAGDKSFTSYVILKPYRFQIKNSFQEIGVIPSSNQWNGIAFTDKNNSSTFSIEQAFFQNGNAMLHFSMTPNIAGGSLLRIFESTYIASANEMVTKSRTLLPDVNNSRNLGSPSLQWNTTYTRNILIDNDINIASSLINKTSTSGVISIRGGLNTQDGASIGLYGKDYNGGIAGNIYMTAYGNSDYTNFRIYPNGAMTVYNNSTSTTKNVAMQEDVIPRSGGAVMTGTRISRADNTSELCIDGGTGFDKGASIHLSGKDVPNSNERGRIYLHPVNGTFGADMLLYADGTLTWNGQSIQTTSDQRYKQQISQIDDDLLTAWEDVNLVQFKYNDAVEQKGNTARLHTGYVVQQIDDACKSHGVDVSKYGLYCHEEYAEETREVEHDDGTKTTEVVRPASEHYSLRYTEALIVECAYLRKKLKELTARIEQLEKGNNTK